jgi:hypothetical protein
MERGRTSFRLGDMRREETARRWAGAG